MHRRQNEQAAAELTRLLTIVQQKMASLKSPEATPLQDLRDLTTSVLRVAPRDLDRVPLMKGQDLGNGNRRLKGGT